MAAAKITLMKCYIDEFFNQLEIYEDLNSSNNNHRQQLHNSIDTFLNDPISSNADKVYETFFTAYWMGIQDDVNPFVELLAKMRSYEKQAGPLLDGHRDHYVHSIYVFLLGLSIYTKNSKYQEAFNNTALNDTCYPDSYKTKHEEFFYRWGLAALFHDIAYPLEITLKQAQRYIEFIFSYQCENQDRNIIILEPPNIDDLVTIDPLLPSNSFKQEYYTKYPSAGEFESCMDHFMLLAHKLHNCFDINVKDVVTNLKEYSRETSQKGFIDHGYYSAIIMLSWYHALIKKTNWNPAYYYYPVLDAASAILLHNYYRHCLMRSPINLSFMRPEQHPIAYLLILCDELQDWNRDSFSINGFDEVIIVNDILITQEMLSIVYRCVEDRYLEKKRRGIDLVLDTSCIFKEGIILTK